MRRFILPTAALAASVLLTACGGGATTSTDDPSTSAPSETVAPSMSETSTEAADFPVTVTSSDGVEVTFDQAPERIVSISPTATENLFAVGAGDQVVAVDTFSYYPEEAPVTDLAAFEPNVEAIAGYDPDLVIVGFDTNDVVAGLRALDIPTVVHAAAVTLDDAWQQMLDTGAMTGHRDEAEELVADLQGEIDELVGSTPDADGLTYYHELDDQYFSATSATFIGTIYGLFGLENIADAQDPDGAAFGYPQLTAEYIIDSDPDLIFLASGMCCQQDAETVSARPGWSEITAVKNGDIVLLDDDIVSRWGPRIVLLAEQVATALEQAAQAA